MKQRFTIILTTIFMLCLCAHLSAQMPILKNYPLVKGYYKSAQKDSSTLFCLTDYGVMIWDVANLSHPVLISKLPAPGIYFQGKIKEYGQYLFIQRFDTIILVDKSNLTNPAYATFNLSLHNINDIDIMDTLLYAGTNSSNGFSVYSIADISNPVLLATLPISVVKQVSIKGTSLFVYNSNSFYRFDISGAIPVIMDSIVFGYSRTILSAKATNNTAIISLGDAMNFNEIIGNYAYDISTVGNPVLIDSTSISINSFNSLLAITDSLLYTHNDSINLYNITDLHNISATDSFGFSYSGDELLIDDTLLFIMNGAFGFNILKQTTPFSHSFVAKHKVGEWFDDLQISSNGYIFAKGTDSVFVFNKSRSTSETFSDFAFINHANQYQVVDSFLLETRLDGLNSIRLSGISNLPVIDSFFTFYNLSNSYLMYVNIWNQKLYNYNTSLGTEIFDISNPSSPVILSGNIPEVYNGFYSNILYGLDIASNNIKLYDASFAPPHFIKQVNAPFPNCNTSSFWDPQRAMVHFPGVNAGCYFQLDLSDTSNINYSATKPMTGMNGAELEMAKIWNNILYLPTVYGNNLAIYDVCDINHFREIGIFKSNKFIQSIVLTDSVLFISYGGYIESYDVSKILPCLVLGITESKENDNALSIYPNPATSTLNIECPQSQNLAITLFNLMGEQVIKSQFTGSKQNIDISGLPSGMYIIKVSGKDWTVQRKLVKE
jgi:hypothetical protein